MMLLPDCRLVSQVHNLCEEMMGPKHSSCFGIESVVGRADQLIYKYLDIIILLLYCHYSNRCVEWCISIDLGS